ncbi:MAG: PEP-CTERM sorting domain-containing protein [Gammaproteobacteria bacterium]|nr:PEP-CTERM sorting domain-containing protein [Gammaproteobacteria bacterium]MDH3858556.1 PEP-CTERM sorting domain-containing protein [Gammaproteobacteria bacterium]
MKRIKLILGASILLLVSAQANAGIISDANPLEGAELWENSVAGSVSNQGAGSILPIFGSMLIDTTVRRSGAYLPQTEICECPVFLDIVSFDLSIGGLSFFGGNSPVPIGDSVRRHSIGFGDDAQGGPPVVAVSSWELTAADGSEVQGSMLGEDFNFYDLDGTDTLVPELYAGKAPALIELRDCCRIVDPDWLLNGSIFLTRVARVPEPSAILLFGIGLIGLVGFSKRRKVS